MKTMKSFIEASAISGRLIRAVVSQVGGWGKFKEVAEGIANYGADAGWAGFTYYSDTVAFAQQHKQEILSKMSEDCPDYGYRGNLEMIKNFGCLKSENLSENEIFDALSVKDSPDRTSVLNALAWYALEEISRSYSDLK